MYVILLYVFEIVNSFIKENINNIVISKCIDWS